MKTLAVTTAFVFLTAGFAASSHAADNQGIKNDALPAITFVKQKAKRSPYVSNAVYFTDADARKRRDQNLLIDVSSKRFKKKLLKKKLFGGRGFRRGGFGHHGFSHNRFGHRGFGHRGFGHGHFGHHSAPHHGSGDLFFKKGVIGKWLFGK